MAAFEPGELCETWLHKHDETPIETRPCVQFRALSSRQLRTFAEEYNASMEGNPDAAGHIDKTKSLLVKYCCGWRNCPGEFNADTIEDVFSLGGMRQILTRIMTESGASVSDKKKSD